MYLKIISYGQRFGEDWSELPVPSFKDLETFAAIVLWVAQRSNELKVELECLLATLPVIRRTSVIGIIDGVP
jgi:hypothetical protein